jgi:hypothetical protein
VLFNPRPRIESVEFGGSAVVWVIDDALLEPVRFVDFAAEHWAHARETTHNAFPGPELPMPEAFTVRLDAWFSEHLRRRLGGRRTLRVHSRFAMATWPASRLQPRQWLCHRDRDVVLPGERVAASVLYLFEDSALGGTAFYAPRRDALATAMLVHDSSTLDAAAFRARHPDVAPGYLVDSNAWFERIGVVEPRFNRLIAYDGDLFHTSHVIDAARLSDDPLAGRLTINGFFTLRVAAA